MNVVHDYDAKWDKIRKSLDVIGVDADTVMVPHGNAQCLLQDKLERLVQQYRDREQARLPTVQQFISEATDNAKKIAVVRDLFAPKLWPMAYVVSDKRAAVIYHLLTAAEVGLHQEVQRAMVGAYQHDFSYEGKRDNASKPALRNYLLRLARVWDELAGKPTPPRYRNRFVHACAATVIPNITIKNVRDYLSKKTKTTI